jgi:hypothetical protein
MPIEKSKKEVFRQIRKLKYLNKDFDGFKQDLLEYARTYFPDSIRDFSEASLGGLLLDMVSYVGDVQSFYLDHQFFELSPETAVETRNIERHLRTAGVPITGASPAVLRVKFLIRVPAVGNPGVPNIDALPVLHSGTTCRADNGTFFELTEDLNFNERTRTGDFVANVIIGTTDANNNPTSYIMSREGVCISGFRTEESFSVGNFAPFKTYTLSRENVSEIISVVDDQGNEYYEVENLTEDTVYKAIPNPNNDDLLVRDSVMPIPAPFRFTKETNLENRLTTLRFGGGSAESTDDDIIPDPSEFAVPLFGKKTFSRFTINPGNLLKTSTLGIVAPNSNITITYRYGGGLSHNITTRTIRGLNSLIISFPRNPTPQVAQSVRASFDAVNDERASGGEDAPTISELRERVSDVRASQSRIVTRQDLLARVYTMPSNFGRVFRAAIHDNPNNPLATQLHVISRDENNQLIISPDTLKMNLAKYLNQYRLISDAIDILDARVINFRVEFSIVVDPLQNNNLVVQNVIRRLQNYFNIRNFVIDQPIVKSDVENMIYNNPGVLSVESLSFENVTGQVGETNPRQYSSNNFDFELNTTRGFIIPPKGGIFELKFPEFDIEATVI